MDPRTTARVRDAAAGDQDVVRAVTLDAFGDDGGTVVALLDALDAAGTTRADLVADVDGEVVGHVRLSRSWLDARERLVDVLVLSPLSVAPAHRGRGTGTALLAAAVQAATRLGAPLVFLEGSPGFYGARGFVRASGLGFRAPSTRIPDAAFQCVALPAHEPWMTGALVYCEPFWALDAVGLRDPLLAELEQSLD